MSNPGLMFVTSRVTDSSKTSDEKYNRFYNDEHLPDVLNYGISKVAIRYKNVNAESKIPYLACYPLDDANFLTSPGLEKLVQDTRSSKTFDNQDVYDYVEFGLRPYEKIQTYEGIHPDSTSLPDPSSHAHTVICVAMEPADEQDFDDWYRKQHLDMMAMLPPYRRTTRYKRLDGEVPRYLAMHEYDCKPDEIPAERAKLVNSEWSRKIIGECKVFDRDVFELVQVQGDAQVQL
ncbi:hypothetical protein BAUCODRAFT_320634 [Baudoinia panamericana UAMH 10762]|uniref:EthD domain-containing protein n=1 Tax=Baudoinia panamericana (strain UAMH 10762) TaxID=717646 RepID=M2M3X4_BAUPA|nr:uncharacterized protein BAUCODRAFT_320634 [Baudoinia panamericana UAMH 10762]EMC91276.1 hypothetical protein BAUCODRAFT_320634 [Baudoinia panamericana UAMH 10762]